MVPKKGLDLEIRRRSTVQVQSYLLISLFTHTLYLWIELEGIFQRLDKESLNSANSRARRDNTIMVQSGELTPFGWYSIQVLKKSGLL